MPEVSVIMGVNNGRQFLAAALASVRAQTFTDWELVIVDNGSTDGGLDAELQAHPDPRLRVFRHPQPLTPGGALRVACREARGRYLAVLDADDIAMPRRLEIQTAYLAVQSEVCLLAGGSELIDEQGCRLGREPLVACHEDIHGLTAYAHVLRHSTVMFRREVLERVEYRAIAGLGADQDFFARVVEIGRVEALPATLCQYRLHPGANSRRVARSSVSRGLIGMLTRRRRRGLQEDLEKWERIFCDVLTVTGDDGGRANLAVARIFSAEGMHDLAALHAWHAMRAGARWRGMARYLRATLCGLGRSRPAAWGTARAWLKEPAHQLLRAGGAPDRPQF